MTGYKTYLAAFALVLVSIAHTLGYIDDETFKNVSVIFGAGGLAALRSAVAAKL